MVQTEVDKKGARAAWLHSLDPDVRELVLRALLLEEEGRKGVEDTQNSWDIELVGYAGWTASDIRQDPNDLLPLIYEGIIKISYDSGLNTRYLIVDPTEEETLEVPEGIFGNIIGHDRVKRLIGNSLKRQLSVHFLLAGPPATAKSLFLEEVSSLPDSRFTLGGSSSKVGIAEYLIMYRPKYLVIDELDKMKYEEYSVLLSLMQSGTIAIMKRKKLVKTSVSTRVFAGVNRKDRLPPELLSRFITFDFKPYTRQEFVDISTQVLVRDLGKDKELADYIAQEASKWTGDVRQVVQLAKLVETQEEVDLYSEEMSERSLETSSYETKRSPSTLRVTQTSEELGLTANMSVEDCIFHLHSKGLERSNIAKVLDIPYQKVRYYLTKAGL